MTMSTLMEKTSHIKQNVSMVEFLARLGFQPHGKPAKETMYISMLRESDTNASFSVNDKMGCWYDHGLGRGGNIIDFAMQFWKGLNYKELIEKIESICQLDLKNLESAPKRARLNHAVKLPNYIIESIKPFGTSEGIVSYVAERAVLEQGKSRLHEIHYHVQDEKGKRKQFYGAAWQNEAGSWEVRNKYYKGCLGKKAITFIPGDHRKVAVFEGYFNYLSWLIEHPADQRSVIVLNSLNMLESGIEKAKAFADIDVYFDHDPAGYRATKEWMVALPYSRDKSCAYQGFNDYNDKLVDELKQERKRHSLGR